MKERIKKPIFIFYLVIEILLYISFLVCDFFGYYNIGYIFKYTSICFNFLIMLILTMLYFNKERLIVLSGTLVTLFADYFLLFFIDETRNITGISCFLIVQLIYFLRLNYIDLNLKKMLLGIIYRTILISIIFILFKTVLKIYDLKINYYALTYFILLLGNVIDPILYNKKSKKNLLISFSLFLLLLCDLSIGIYNVVILSPTIYFLEWMFYLPSQVFLVLSTFYKDDKHKENSQ